MKPKELKLKIKEQQKQLAKDIRIGKFARKPKNRTADNRKYYEERYWNSVNFRHTHIAYCEFFNKTPYERIESNPRNTGYPFSRTKIDNLKSKWKEIINE